MSRHRNPFVAAAPDAAQRIVDLETALAAMTVRAEAAEAQVARTLRACWVDAPDGKRHTVRAKDAQAAVAQIGVGSIFRGYIA
jgi:hypothetical protein